MAYALFNENGYDYFDDYNQNLFSADNTHVDLFEYITKDFSCLPELLEQYISQRLDITTFKLKKKANSTECIDRIEEILKSSHHPYYVHEHRKVIKNAIGNYFNELLVYSCYRLESLSDEYAKDKAWYTDKINFLMEPLLKSGDTAPTDFYDKLQKWIHPEEYGIEEFLTIDIPRKIPSGFDNEIETQVFIYNMLYFILDISVLGIKELTIPQRIWLYSNIFDEKNYHSAEMGITQLISFLPPVSHQNKHAYSFNTENEEKLNEIFYPLHNIRTLNIGRDGIPANLMKNFNAAVENAKSITTTAVVHEKYEIDNLKQLLYLEVISMIKSNIMIRKCKNCGKYFIVNNRKTVYCNRIDEHGMCCSAVGPNRSFQQKLKEDEALKIYTRAYKTHFARFRKKTMTQEDFSNWCADAKRKLNEVRSETLDIAAFQEWLKK